MIKQLSTKLKATALALAVSFTFSKADAAAIIVDGSLAFLGTDTTTIPVAVDTAGDPLASDPYGITMTLPPVVAHPVTGAPVDATLSHGDTLNILVTRANQLEGTSGPTGNPAFEFTDVFSFYADDTVDVIKFHPGATANISELSYSFTGLAGSFIDLPLNGSGTFWAQLTEGLNTLYVKGITALNLNGSNAGPHYGVEISAVPLPPAAIAFGSALIGMGFLGRRRKNKEMTA